MFQDVLSEKDVNRNKEQNLMFEGGMKAGVTRGKKKNKTK